MSDQTIFCNVCMKQTPHVKSGASTIMCSICRTQRPWNTTGWQQGDRRLSDAVDGMLAPAGRRRARGGPAAG